MSVVTVGRASTFTIRNYIKEYRARREKEENSTWAKAIYHVISFRISSQSACETVVGDPQHNFRKT